MGMIDSKLTPYDVKNIVLLNKIMGNNEYYTSITSTDVECITPGNIHLSTRVLELYTYLIKNYHLIPRLFNDDMASNWNKLRYLMGMLDDNNKPIGTILRSIGITE